MKRVVETHIVDKGRWHKIFIDEAFEEAGFWILAGLGVGAEIIGYIVSKRMGLEGFPWWQLLILIVGTIVASAFFATKD